MAHPVQVLPITLGTAFLGDQSDVDAIADALIASPLGHVDTSNNYAGGLSESALGGAIRRAGGLPPGKSVITKVDRDGAGVFDGDRVLRSLDESLTRLGIDHLPLLHFHDPYTVTFAEAMGGGGAVPALVRLRDEGVVDAIGIASGTMAQVHEYVETEVFDAVLSHNRFTLVDRTAEPTFRRARELGMTVFNAAPFGGGTLANGEARYGYQDMPAEFAAHVDRVRALARDFGIDLAAAALQFSLRSPLIDSTIVGVTRLEDLSALPGLRDAVVPGEFFAAVDALGPPPPNNND